MYVNVTQFSSSLIFLTELSYLLITLPIHESNTVVVVIRSFFGYSYDSGIYFDFLLAS